MSNVIRSYAATTKGGKLEPYEFDAGPLRDEQVEIAVEYCGLCHSDLSMLEDDWRISSYPFVPGHEAVGKIIAVGDRVKNLKIGQRVGLGWMSECCNGCQHCLSGDQHLCLSAEATIVGRHGGFADKVRCHWMWAIPLPDALDIRSAGPLFCGGITVFTPIVIYDVKPTDRVGVIGIGGLGHLAVQFLAKWGCEVTAFTSSDSKAEEARRMGAHHVVNSRDPAQLAKIAGSLDFILCTVNVSMPWGAIITCLARKGRLHFVGAVLEPVPVEVFPLMEAQNSISGSPIGGPVVTTKMLEFCARHEIQPITQHFKLTEVNDALDHLRAGKARYRVVLENDLG